MDDKLPGQLPAITRVEVSYLDIQGNPVDSHKAVRVITREYDANGNLIRTRMTLDYSKGNASHSNKN